MIDYIPLNEARAYITRYCNSYETLPTLIEFRYRMHYPEWCTLLGEEWSACDNMGVYLKALKLAMFFGRRPRTLLEMMDDAERDALSKLPEVVTIYRGCGRDNRDGLSWSLDRDVAAGFPFLNRYRQEKPLIVTATVRHDRICALKLERKEQEVITFSAKRVAVDSLLAVA